MENTRESKNVQDHFSVYRKYQATKENLKFTYGLCSRNISIFLHKFKGEEEMEWWKSQLKEKHFPKAIFRVLENLVHASVITILNGIVPTQKMWKFWSHKIFFDSN